MTSTRKLLLAVAVLALAPCCIAGPIALYAVPGAWDSLTQTGPMPSAEVQRRTLGALRPYGIRSLGRETRSQQTDRGIVVFGPATDQAGRIHEVQVEFSRSGKTAWQLEFVNIDGGFRYVRK